MPLEINQLNGAEDLSSHGFGLAPTLKLAQALGGPAASAQAVWDLHRPPLKPA
jgi:hypothetical protein